MSYSKTFIALALLLVFVSPRPVNAAENACVSLLVGAGYAAHMRIKSGDFRTGWSGSFAIGKTKCKSLKGVPVGNEYTVEVKAILGKSKNCSPSMIHTAGGGSKTWQAWGTSLSVKCKMPSTDEVAIESGYEANKDGIKAAKSLDKE